MTEDNSGNLLATSHLRFVRREVRSEVAGDMVWQTRNILQQAFLVTDRNTTGDIVGRHMEWRDVPLVDDAT